MSQERFARTVVTGDVPAVILASASPRREALLRGLGVEVEVVPPEIEELPRPGESAAERAERLAVAKVTTVAERYPGRLVIAADTVVATAAGVLGKPAGPAEAREMLRALSDATHEVITGVAVARDGRIVSGMERTQVTFRALGADEIEAYVATDEPYDKAGAYGAQGLGGAFISGVNGCFFNVVGLPIVRLTSLIRRLEDPDD